LQEKDHFPCDAILVHPASLTSLCLALYTLCSQICCHYEWRSLQGRLAPLNPHHASLYTLCQASYVKLFSEAETSGTNRSHVQALQSLLELQLWPYRVQWASSEHEISQEGQLCLPCTPVNVALQCVHEIRAPSPDLLYAVPCSALSGQGLISFITECNKTHHSQAFKWPGF